MRIKQQAYTHVVKSTVKLGETRHFPVAESKATAGKPYSSSKTRNMTSPEVIFTIYRRTTVSPYHVLKVPKDKAEDRPTDISLKVTFT